jgi:hypothetical protein
MEKHVQLIGRFWIALGAMSFIAGFFVFGLLFGISFVPDIGGEAPAILRGIGLGVGIFLWVLSAPRIICGIGLMKRMEWARILTLIVAFLSILDIPLGTALAVYSFVILLKDETIKLFKT